MPFSTIADQLGITKARVSQLRSTAPAAERAFFGIGPITVVMPYRLQTTDRERPLLAAEDVAAADLAKDLLQSYDFTVRTAQTGPDDTNLPDGDLFVICGPKSSPAVGELLDADPRLEFVHEDTLWAIGPRDGDNYIGSSIDLDVPDKNHDVAYVSRRTVGRRTITHIAGIHAIGSLGAVEYLRQGVAALHKVTAGRDFSTVVPSKFDGLKITEVGPIWEPLFWDEA